MSIRTKLSLIYNYTFDSLIYILKHLHIQISKKNCLNFSTGQRGKCLYVGSSSTQQYMVCNCLGLISGFVIILSTIWLKWEVTVLKGKKGKM